MSAAAAAAATCCPTAAQHFKYGGAEDEKTEKIFVSDSSAIRLVAALFHRYRSQGGRQRRRKAPHYPAFPFS